MKSLISKQVERFLREQKNYKRWLAVFLCLAVVVTIGTTAALKYKGIAATSDDPVTDEMHMNEASAEATTQEPEIVLIDGVQYIRHVHTDACYEEQKVFICEEGKAEVGKSEETGSAGSSESTGTAGGSGDSGNTGTTGGHHHDDSCYVTEGGERKLDCGKSEHTHDSSCHGTKTETVTKTVTETVEDGKDEAGNVITKEVEKEVTEEVTEDVITCGKEEHTHDDSCYTTTGETKKLVCGMEEGEGAEAAPASETAEAASEPAAEEAPAAETADADAATEVPAADTDATTEAPAADTDATTEAPATDTDATTEAPATDTDATTEAPAADTDAATEGGHIHTENCYEMQQVLICGLEEGELVCLEDVSGNDLVYISGEQTVETENCIVTVSYTEEAKLLEGTELRVTEYAKDSQHFIERCEELGYEPDWLLNVGFYFEDVEVEPWAAVDVKVTDKLVDNAVDYKVVHFADDGIEKVENDVKETGDSVETSFSIDSFSDIAGTSEQDKRYGNQVAEVAPLGTLDHEKTVNPTENEDGVYDLTLSVKGAVGTNGEKAKMDIIIVLDTSGSMGYDLDGNEIEWWSDEKSRREHANEEIEKLVNGLAEDENLDVQYKLIKFSKTANLAYSNWGSASSLTNALPDSAGGGTNYEAALRLAGETVESSRDGAKTVVLFLTDGLPTYYNGGGNGSTTTSKMVEGAVNGAKTIGGDYFFAVGFGSEMTTDKKNNTSGKSGAQILEEVAKNTTSGTHSATTTRDLTGYFTSFQESLTRIRATDVKFTDKLTEEVDIVTGIDEDGNPIVVETPGAANWKVKIADENGIVLDESDEEYGKANMQVKYDGTNGLEVTFAEGYELRQNYTYSVTTKIAPNEKAIKKYEEAYTYPDRGDEGTGLYSSNQMGIFCNQEKSAEVSYKYYLKEVTVGDEGTTEIDIVKPDGDPLKADYLRPVVQLVKKPPMIENQAMTHDKYIKKVSGLQDTYDLTLDLTGRVGSTTDPAPYDILFVVDRSGSMKETDATMTTTKEVVDHDNLICMTPEHVHTKECCKDGSEEHTHNIWCYNWWGQLICKQTEHTHSAACLTCNMIGHTHTDNCYGRKIETSTTNNAMRIDAAKAAMNSLIDAVENNNSNIDARYSLVSFAKTATTDQGWTDDESAIKSRINSLNANEGTNYQDGLEKAGEQMKSAREGATTVVIFLTDGVPTYYKTNSTSTDRYNGDKYYNGEPAFKGEYTGGSGYTDHDTTVNKSWTGAEIGASTIRCNEFYNIGFGGDMASNGSKLTQHVSNEVTATTRRTVTTTDLTKIFEEIIGKIQELRCHDVTVTDELSDYVEIAAENVEEGALLKIEVKNFTTYEDIPNLDGNSNVGTTNTGASYKLGKTSKNAEATITARYDAANKKVVLDFPGNYKLESGYKYYVTIRIKPTQKAWDEAKELPIDPETGELIYPNEGEEKTDHPTTPEENWISDGKLGFYTNKKAEVTFKYGYPEDPGGGEEELYQRPVIRVGRDELTILKTVVNLSDEQTAELFAGMRFTIDGTEVVSVPEEYYQIEQLPNDVKKYSLTNMATENRENNGNGSYTYQIKTEYVVPASYNVAEVWDGAKLDGFDCKTQYKVNSGAVTEGTPETGNVTARVEVKAGEGGKVEFINTYETIKQKLQLIKTDQDGNKDSIFNMLEFVIKAGSVDPKDKLKADIIAEVNQLETVATLTIHDGIASDEDGNSIFKLPVGTYTVVEDRLASNMESTLIAYKGVHPFEIRVLGTGEGEVEVKDINHPDFKNGSRLSYTKGEDGLVKINVENTRKELEELRLLKVSADNNGVISGLPGAEFDLYKMSGEKPDREKDEKIASLKGDGEGVFKNEKLKDLVAGNYYLVETKAPDGYMIYADEIKFAISAEENSEGNLIPTISTASEGVYLVVKLSDGSYKKVVGNDLPYGEDEGKLYWTLAVTNSTGAELPVTGGPGTTAYTFGGLAMIIAVSLMYGLNMRRKREKGGMN